ncbi:MAG: hypothetical protein WCI73_13570 [Phycisphaerae bacterium]
MTTTRLCHRITSLERWGMRVAADFQPESVARIAAAGFTGVLVNGGSGIGPDMLTPESLLTSPVIPDLMPLTIRGHEREMKRRCDLLAQADLKPWLCLWGVPGPDDSANSWAADSNRFFDRRSKLEMSAKLARTPDLFGQRNPQTLSWRGSRPLCVSHPIVRAYYRDLFPRLLAAYPQLEGIFFFPGDNDPELCDEHCPRCRASGLDPWGVMLRYVNELYTALDQARPGFKFYFTIWNQDKPESAATIQRFSQELHPGIGICMTLSDNVTQQRKSGPMIFNQPWVNFAQPGQRFLETTRTAHAQGRAIMVLAEISQSEVWDPVCHNMPNAPKVLELLRNAEQVPGVDALCDFWGHRGPFVPHANHAALRAYLDHPAAAPADLLRQAALAHYNLAEAPSDLTDQALACWQKFDAAVDDWALNLWAQRFSFAIGRDGARGPHYRPLIPVHLREFYTSWGMKVLRERQIEVERFVEFQYADRVAFLAVAAAFEHLAARLAAAGFSAGSALREGRHIALAGELVASQGRTFAAALAFAAGDTTRLRHIIEEEIDARERQLELSARAGWGGGVNPILVSEDIQNMRLYLSRDDFPHTPDTCFHFTPTPYSV